MTGAEKVSSWLAGLRATGSAAWVSRAVTAGAGIVALAVPAFQPWHQLGVVTLIGAFALLTSIVLPDSGAALSFLVVVAGGWLLRAPKDLTWGLAVTATALLVTHLACAFAGKLPSYVQVGPRALRRWLLPTAIAVGLGPAVAVAAAGARDADLPGSLLVTVSSLAAITAVAWFASGRSTEGG
jgi:hypothetical protein